MPATSTDRLFGLTTSVAVKAPCRLATTGPIVLSGLQTIDGLMTVEGDRVLVKDQPDATENGIWNAHGGAWRRALDFNGTLDVVKGTALIVISGAANIMTEWLVNTANPVIIGTSAMEFGLIPNIGFVPAAGPWEYEITTPTTEFTALDSVEHAIVVRVNDQVLTETDDYTRSGDTITLLVPAQPGDLVRINALPDVESMETFRIRAEFIKADDPDGNLSDVQTELDNRALTDLSNVSGFNDVDPDFEGSGIVAVMHDRMIFTQSAPTNADGWGVRFLRRPPAGGTTGVNAAVVVDTTTQAGTATFEFNLLAKLLNYATTGQHTAFYAQAQKFADSATISGVSEAIDPRNIANPTSGMAAFEVDVRACGTDNLNARNGLDIVATRLGPDGAHTGADMVCGSGLSFQNGLDTGHASFGRLIWAKPGTTAVIGIDFSAATIGSAAMVLATNQAICFSADLTRKVYHSGGGYQFTGPAGTPVASIGDSGAYGIAGTQVIGSRNTGWTAPTGTATKGGFDTATVTLPQLAAQMKALQDALTLHGLIGV